MASDSGSGWEDEALGDSVSDDDGPPMLADDDVASSSNWESGSEAESEGESWESRETDEVMGQEAHGEEAVNILLELLMHSAISAKVFCNICYHCGLGGLKGPAKNYGMHPDRPAHRAQRKLDNLLGFTEHDKALMYIDTVGHLKDRLGRQEFKLPCIPPHEALDAEVAGTPSILEGCAP